MKRRKWEAYFGILNRRFPYGLQGDMFSGCYNRNVLHRKAFQAGHQNQSGGEVLIKLEIKALGRDGATQGGLTEQKRAWQEPSFCGVLSFSQHIQSIRCQHREANHFPDLQCPGTLVVPLSQAWGLPSSALAHFQSLASPTLEYSYQPLTTLPSPPSDLHPWRAASLGWVLIPR